MKAPATRRREGREWALQMIVQADLNPFVTAQSILDHFWELTWSCRQEDAGKTDDDLDDLERALHPEERLASTGLREFTEVLVRGVLEHLDELDTILMPYCVSWPLDRLGVIERCVLRLAVYEMKLAKEPVPAPVVINEAVDLAKYFSNVESGKFVNGILDLVAKGKAPAAAPETFTPAVEPVEEKPAKKAAPKKPTAKKAPAKRAPAKATPRKPAAKHAPRKAPAAK